MVRTRCTIEELGGGQFSVNGAGPRVWTEFLSDSLNTPAQCAACTGMLPNDGTTGAPVTDFPECDNYAQGSARVTLTGTGPNGVGLQELGLINLGFLAGVGGVDALGAVLVARSDRQRLRADVDGVLLFDD